MPPVTAIVATYNRRGYLEETIASLRAQTSSVDQIVIWDDGSTDGTEAYGRALAAADRRVLYRRGANRGKSAALNAALTEATGELIWICDDDDVALPHAAATLRAAMSDGRAGLAAGRHDRFRDDPRTGARRRLGTGYWPDLRDGSVLRHLLEDIFFFQNATFVRRGALDRAGPFREDLARSIDYEMFVRLAVRVPVALTDEVLFLQRKHDGARGPASGRHAAAASDDVWCAADRAIFDGLRDVLPLTLYEALFAADDPVLLRRAALLQRATVYARRTDWDAALSDLRAAAASDAPGRLTRTEHGILTRAMAGKHERGAAFRAPVRSALLGLGDAGPLGPGIVAVLGRAARWRAREALRRRDPATAARVAAFVLRAGRPPPPGDAALAERRELEPSAYAW